MLKIKIKEIIKNKIKLKILLFERVSEKNVESWVEEVIQLL